MTAANVSTQTLSVRIWPRLRWTNWLRQGGTWVWKEKGQHLVKKEAASSLWDQWGPQGAAQVWGMPERGPLHPVLPELILNSQKIFAWEKDALRYGACEELIKKPGQPLWINKLFYSKSRSLRVSLLAQMLKNILQWRRPGFGRWVRKSPWRREWQPTPVFWPGKFHGQRSLVDYSP